jgi:hypothetical protein
MRRNIFLVIGAIIGLCVAAPIVISYAAAWWWFSAPLIAVYAFVLWRWGLAWINDGDVDDVSVFEKTLGVAILLVWTFIGVALAVYLAMLAAQYWMAIVASLLLVVAVGLWFWVADLIDKGRKRAAGAPEPLATPNLNDPPKSDDLVR